MGELRAAVDGGEGLVAHDKRVALVICDLEVVVEVRLTVLDDFARLAGAVATRGGWAGSWRGAAGAGARAHRGWNGRLLRTAPRVPEAPALTVCANSGFGLSSRRRRAKEAAVRFSLALKVSVMAERSASMRWAGCRLQWVK
eukprot:scaffold29832_cov112-Isochrysis_galbana.AAC.9